MSHNLYKSIFIMSTIFTLGGCSDPAGQSATANPATSSSAGDQVNNAVHSMTQADLAVAKSTAQCSLDKLNDTVLSDSAATVTVKAGQNIAIGGWAVDGSMQAPPKVTFVLEGTRSFGFDGMTGVSRPDVAKALNAENAGQSGFNITESLGDVPVGSYKAVILLRASNGNEICDTKRRVIIGA